MNTRRDFMKRTGLGAVLGIGILSSLTKTVYAADTSSQGVKYTASCPEAALYPRFYPADASSQNYVQQHLTERVHLGYANEPDVDMSLKIYQDFSTTPNTCVPNLRVRIYREAEVSFDRWYASIQSFVTWHAKVCDLVVRNYQCVNGVVKVVSSTHSYPNEVYPNNPCALRALYNEWPQYNDPGWALHLDHYEDGSISAPNDTFLGNPGATLTLDTHSGGAGAWSDLWTGTRAHAVTCCNLS